MFADDAKLFRVIKEKDRDNEILQQDIDAMMLGTLDWLMEF